MIAFPRTIVILSSLLYKVSTISALNPTAKCTRIQVCQNKGCVKNFPSKYDGGLVQTLHDLIPSSQAEAESKHDNDNKNSVIIEATGCLSQCTNGPNICVNERVFGNVKDIQMAAAILDVGADIDSPGVLMAAIENIAAASKTTVLAKRLSLLDGAIQSLQDEGLGQTSALAHALVIRADVHMDSIPQNVDQALKDAMQAVQIDDLNGRVWRVVADAKEAKNDVPGAIDAISNWASKNPSFSAKAKKELERLSSTRASSSTPNRNFNP